MGLKGWINMQLRQSEAHLSINHFGNVSQMIISTRMMREKLFNQLCEGMVASPEWIHFDSKTLLDYQIITFWETSKDRFSGNRSIRRRVILVLKSPSTIWRLRKITNFGPRGSWSLPRGWKLFRTNPLSKYQILTSWEQFTTNLVKIGQIGRKLLNF